MKKIIYFLIAIFISINAWGASATFEWDAPIDDDLAGYRIHWGTATGIYANTVDVKNVTIFKIDDLPDGKLFFAATAYDTADNESAYSNEVVVTFNTIAPGRPLNFKVTITEAKSVSVEVE
jgi:hypothetical protein